MPNFVRESPPAAEWLRPSELDDPYFQHGAGKILLGQRKDGRKIGVADNRHIVTIAGSRAGKSATSLMPNLLEWRGSVLAIDPKGELATNTAKHRADMGQNVVILDPFGEVKGEAAQYRKRFDPISEIKAGGEVDIIDNAALIADALIVPDTVPLLATHELALQFARERNNKLVMIAGRPPFALRRVFWKDMIDGQGS